MINFQRIDSTSNAKVGSDFELTAKEFFRNEGITLKNTSNVLVIQSTGHGIGWATAQIVFALLIVWYAWRWRT